MANIGGFRGNGITLYIAGDTKQLDRALTKATNDVNTFVKKSERAGKKAETAQAGLFGGAFGRGGKVNQGLRGLASGTGLGSAALFGSGAFIGAALSAGALKKSIDAASDLNEQITKSQQVFAGASKSVLDWSKDTAKNIGIARSAALQASGTFGNLFKAQGFGDIQNSKLSKSLVQLAADLASFNNVDVNEVLQDLSSGLVGEIEPVRKYGADLRIARVQQEALAETGKDNVKQLTQQELTLARLHLLYKDTAAAQGDFKRTSGGLANQERILSAQVEDLAANLGTLLTPAVTGIVTGLNDLASVANIAAKGLQNIADIKIPAIHIPLLFDIGGGTAGNVFGKLAKIAGTGFISPAAAGVEIVKLVHDSLSDGVSNATKQSTPQLASDFENSFNGYFKSAINTALANVDIPRAGLGDTFADGLRAFLESTRKKVQDKIGKVKAGIATVNLVDSLQLGVEKSQVSGSLATQLSALEALKTGIQKQIKQGVDVRNAQHQLVAVESQIASTQEQIKQEGIDKIIGSLGLAVTKADLTKGLGDNLKALEDLANGYRAQIRAGNDVLANQQSLASTLVGIKDLKEQIKQNAKDALTKTAFQTIGLSATGGEIIPGVSNLQKQFESIKKRLPDEMGTALTKLANRLKGVGKVLADPIKSAIPEVRSSINELFDAIRGELDKGPLTKTTSLNSNKILKGLGLDATSAKELKARLSNFNSARVGLSAGVAASAQGVAFGAGAPNVIVNVELDGQKIAKSTTVHQQKRARSNPPQKRGPIGGRI